MVLQKAIKYALLAFFAHRLLLLIHILGFHKTVYNHHPGPCRRIEALAQGSEDMERIPDDKILITTGLRFVQRNNPLLQDRVGQVYMLDLNSPDDEPQAVEISNYPGDMSHADFHGLSSWVDKDSGEIVVFIVNHAEDYSAVDIFSYDPDDNTLYHQETVGEGDNNIHLLNDVVAVGKNEFYATNYMYTRHTMNKLEDILHLKWGSVVFYDGQLSSIVQHGFFGPNGINKSPDGRFIYLSHIGAQEIVVFERNSDDSLTRIQTWPTYTLSDNIIVDEDTGDLWLGCHMVGYQVMFYLQNPTLISPSQVLRLRTENGVIVDMTEVFVDDGKLISGSSVGLYAKGKLLIGSVASQTAICDVKYI